MTVLITTSRTESTSVLLGLRSPDPLLASIFIIMTSCGRREGVWSTARTDFVSGIKVLNHRNANYRVHNLSESIRSRREVEESCQQRLRLIVARKKDRSRKTTPGFATVSRVI